MALCLMLYVYLFIGSIICLDSIYCSTYLFIFYCTLWTATKVNENMWLLFWGGARSWAAVNLNMSPKK